jgi:hypothetical protein
MMIEGIQEQVRRGDYRFTIHAFERCVERDISPEHIRGALGPLHNLLKNVILEVGQKFKALRLSRYGSLHKRETRNLRNIPQNWTSFSPIRLCHGGKNET